MASIDAIAGAAQLSRSAPQPWVDAFLRPEPWMAEAACAGSTDPDSFFPEKGASPEAIAVCGRCPVRTECLGYAVEHDERFGIWGGLSARERGAS
jgi:WhiB family redox-sensing transcriptional regulator